MSLTTSQKPQGTATLKVVRSTAELWVDELDGGLLVDPPGTTHDMGNLADDPVTTADLGGL